MTFSKLAGQVSALECAPTSAVAQITSTFLAVALSIARANSLACEISVLIIQLIDTMSTFCSIAQSMAWKRTLTRESTGHSPGLPLTSIAACRSTSLCKDATLRGKSSHQGLALWMRSAICVPCGWAGVYHGRMDFASKLLLTNDIPRMMFAEMVLRIWSAPLSMMAILTRCSLNTFWQCRVQQLGGVGVFRILGKADRNSRQYARSLISLNLGISAGRVACVSTGTDSNVSSAMANLGSSANSSQVRSLATLEKVTSPPWSSS